MYNNPTMFNPYLRPRSMFGMGQQQAAQPYDAGGMGHGAGSAPPPFTGQPMRPMIGLPPQQWNPQMTNTTIPDAPNGPWGSINRYGDAGPAQDPAGAADIGGLAANPAQSYGGLPFLPNQQQQGQNQGIMAPPGHGPNRFRRDQAAIPPPGRIRY